MIRSFANKETARVWERRFSRNLPQGIQRPAYRKLAMIATATRLDDLRLPPGNRLEALGGKRRGRYSVRINDQWRICFRRDGGSGDAHEVEIVDYH